MPQPETPEPAPLPAPEPPAKSEVARPLHSHRILLITGMSGAGKSTALHTLEDLGWEVADNLPLTLVRQLIAAGLAEGAPSERPLAIVIDSRTRGFDAAAIGRRVAAMRAAGDRVAVLFLDCNDAELVRRYSETRRRHPLALDRPAIDGIVREREMLAPLFAFADAVIDTSGMSSQDLRLDLRARYGRGPSGDATLTLMSFGYARGLPREADLVFDMRFLRNPHWDAALRPKTGLDAAVGTYIAADPAYADVMDRIEGLLAVLLPRYRVEGKAYITIAFGCTGGRHRSVYCTHEMAERLRRCGFSPTVIDRDLSRGDDGAIDCRRRHERVAEGGQKT